MTSSSESHQSKLIHTQQQQVQHHIHHESTQSKTNDRHVTSRNSTFPSSYTHSHSHSHSCPYASVSASVSTSSSCSFPLSSSSRCHQRIGLETLPEDALAIICSHLSLRDIARLQVAFPTRAFRGATYGNGKRWKDCLSDRKFLFNDNHHLSDLRNNSTNPSSVTSSTPSLLTNNNGSRPSNQQKQQSHIVPIISRQGYIDWQLTYGHRYLQEQEKQAQRLREFCITEQAAKREKNIMRNIRIIRESTSNIWRIAPHQQSAISSSSSISHPNKPQQPENIVREGIHGNIRRFDWRS